MHVCVYEGKIIDMKNFCFTVDDNIRVFKELTQGVYNSLFEHPYLRVYKRLHEKYRLKVQLNLFYQADEFDLSQMTERFQEEWRANAHWLKLSFHSRLENIKPYENAGYDEVFTDCQNVHREIRRFAGDEVLGKTTTVHFCLANSEGLAALQDNGVRGLLGLYGTQVEPRLSYQSTTAQGERIRKGEIVESDGIAYAGIDIVLNCFDKEEILRQLNALASRDLIKVMIHEQYFYPDYPLYQPDFEEKLDAAFAYLCHNGYQSRLFEELL